MKNPATVAGFISSEEEGQSSNHFVDDLSKIFVFISETCY